MAEPTKEQAGVLARFREVYGRATVKPHAPNPATGVMRVELKCQAGVWQWYIGTDGGLIDSYLTARLFEPEPPKHVPGNAIDN